MIASDTPAMAADVATPIPKLCPEYHNAARTHPKTHRHVAAHSISLSCDRPCFSHICFRICVSTGVIGNTVETLLANLHVSPFKTYSN